MEPNERLKRLRDLVADLIKQIDSGGDNPPVDVDDVNRLVELVQSLDTWISRGGYLPSAWSGEGLNHLTFMASRSEFSRLLQDYERMLAQVTETQDANTKLLEENRQMKADQAASLHALLSMR